MSTPIEVRVKTLKNIVILLSQTIEEFVQNLSLLAIGFCLAYLFLLFKYGFPHLCNRKGSQKDSKKSAQKEEKQDHDKSKKQPRIKERDILDGAKKRIKATSAYKDENHGTFSDSEEPQDQLEIENVR